MEPERGPGAYADSFARYITKQYGACGNTRALDLYIYALWGQHCPLHLISNDKSSAVVNYLNGFRICDRLGQKRETKPRRRAKLSARRLRVHVA